MDQIFGFISLFKDDGLGLAASAISMISFGFADSLWKVPTNHFGAARTIFYRNLFALLVIVPYYLLSTKKSYIAQDAVLATFGIGLTAYLGLYFFARATRSGMTSVVVPVSGANTLITLLLSIITLEAELNWISTLGILSTIVGLSLLKINWRNGKIEFIILKNSGLRFATLAAIFWGFSFAYSYYAVTFTGPALFTLILELVILAASGIHMLVSERTKPVDPQKWKQLWPVVAMIGILGVTGSIFNTIALDRASINTVTGIVALAPAISVIFGQYYYDERLSRQQRLAVVLIIAGVFAISYFRYYK